MSVHCSLEPPGKTYRAKCLSFGAILPVADCSHRIRLKLTATVRRTLKYENIVCFPRKSRARATVELYLNRNVRGLDLYLYSTEFNNSSNSRGLTVTCILLADPFFHFLNTSTVWGVACLGRLLYPEAHNLKPPVPPPGGCFSCYEDIPDLEGRAESAADNKACNSGRGACTFCHSIPLYTLVQQTRNGTVISKWHGIEERTCTSYRMRSSGLLLVTEAARES